VRHQVDVYLKDCGIGEDERRRISRDFAHDRVGAHARGERGQRCSLAKTAGGGRRD
jgi:hypothetical protein